MFIFLNANIIASRILSEIDFFIGDRVSSNLVIAGTFILGEGGETVFIEQELFLTDLDVGITLKTPRFSPRVFDDPVLLTGIILAPTDDLHGMTSLESGGTFKDSVYTVLIDQEISVDGDICDDGTVLEDFSLDVFDVAGNAIVNNLVLLTLVDFTGARNVGLTLVAEAVFVNETLLLGEFQERGNSTTRALVTLGIFLA